MVDRKYNLFYTFDAASDAKRLTQQTALRCEIGYKLPLHVNH